VLAIMSSASGDDRLESTRAVIGIERSTSEVSPCARELPLVREVSMSERVVDEDKNEGSSGLETGWDWNWEQVGFSDEGNSARITPLRTAGVRIADD
jgi:hypothetical protein